MKQALSLVALMFGILSIPSFLWWLFLSKASLFGDMSIWHIHSITDLLFTVIFVAGWLGWVSLGWVAANFESIGLNKFPRWVIIGLMAGIASVESSWIILGINQINSAMAFAFFFFGGAPFCFAIVALIKHAIIYRTHYQK